MSSARCIPTKDKGMRATKRETYYSGVEDQYRVGRKISV